MGLLIAIGFCAAVLWIVQSVRSGVHEHNQDKRIAELVRRCEAAGTWSERDRILEYVSDQTREAVLQRLARG